MEMSWIYEIFYALFFIFPAYVANAIPVILGGGRAIDAGRRLSNGKPIFGSHKTIRGFVAGIMAGTLSSAVENGVLQFGGLGGLTFPFNSSVCLGFAVSCGALLGDLVHSFFKRRIGVAEGSPLPVADQLDFVVGAILLSFLVSPPPPRTIIIIFVITLPVHLLANFLAHTVGLKKTPW